MKMLFDMRAIQNRCLRVEWSEVVAKKRELGTQPGPNPKSHDDDN